MSMRTPLAWISCTLILGLLSSPAAADPSSADPSDAALPATGTFGVYQMVLDHAEGEVNSIAEAIAGAALRSGWIPLAISEVAAPGKCSYTAKVVALYEKNWAGRLLDADPVTGAYAIVDRVDVFQDEAGTHVAVVDPRSISRTVLMDDESFAPVAQDHLQALRELITSAVEGRESHHAYGQARSRGTIAKTMGVVAGGRFVDLLRDKAKVKNGDLDAVAEAVADGLKVPGRKWGLHLVYRLDLPDHHLVILGVSGAAMEARSFKIVKAGGDETRKDYACPGLADAAAYPLELVVHRDGDAIKVSMVEAMFRMKMYFEDAGKWAFMNNMKMPGSIDKEIRKQVGNGLKKL